MQYYPNKSLYKSHAALLLVLVLWGIPTHARDMGAQTGDLPQTSPHLPENIDLMTAEKNSNTTIEQPPIEQTPIEQNQNAQQTILPDLPKMVPHTESLIKKAHLTENIGPIIGDIAEKIDELWAYSVGDSIIKNTARAVKDGEKEIIDHEFFYRFVTQNRTESGSIEDILGDRIPFDQYIRDVGDKLNAISGGIQQLMDLLSKDTGDSGDTRENPIVSPKQIAPENEPKQGADMKKDYTNPKIQQVMAMGNSLLEIIDQFQQYNDQMSQDLSQKGQAFLSMRYNLHNLLRNQAVRYFRNMRSSDLLGEDDNRG